jgi:PPP family 3-phenylpropionic acid transporter
MVIAYAVYFTAVGAGWPYLPVYYRSLGLSLGLIGGLTALAATCQLLAAPLWGNLDDRTGHRPATAVTAATVATLGAGLLAIAGGLPAVVIGAATLAVGLAGIGPLLDTRALQSLDGQRHRYGQLRAWGSVAFVVSSELVGILIDRTGPRGLFAAYLPALLATAAVVFLLPQPPRRGVTSPTWRGSWELLRRPQPGRFVLVLLVVWTALAAVNSYYSVQIVALGGSADQVGLAWAVGAAVEAGVMWSFPRLARRYGAGTVMTVGVLAFALRALLAALAPDPHWLVAISPIEGIGFALVYVGSVTHVAGHTPPQLAATGQGLLGGTSGLAVVLGSGLAGLAVGPLGISGLFAVAAAASGLAAIGLAAVSRD